MLVHDGPQLYVRTLSTSDDCGGGNAVGDGIDAGIAGVCGEIDMDGHDLIFHITGGLGFPPPRARASPRGKSSTRVGAGGKEGEEEEAAAAALVMAWPGMATLRAVEHLELRRPLYRWLHPELPQPSAPLRLCFPPPMRAHPFRIITYHNDWRRIKSVHLTTALSFPDPLPASIRVPAADGAKEAACSAPRVVAIPTDPDPVASPPLRAERKKGKRSRWDRGYCCTTQPTAASTGEREAPRVVAISRDPARAFRGGASAPWSAKKRRTGWDRCCYYYAPPPPPPPPPMSSSSSSANSGHDQDAPPTQASPPLHLTEDVITDILLRLPAKSLVRLQCVCRPWGELTTGRRFVLRHMDLAKEKDQQRGLRLVLSPDVLALQGLRQSLNLYSYTLGAPAADHFFEKVFPEKNQGDSSVWVLRHCDGLLLYATGNHVYVCNPSTGESVTLPPARPDLGLGGWYHHRHNFTLGFDPSTGEYKVVHCFNRGKLTASLAASVGCEVFTLGSSRRRPRWELTAEDPPYPLIGRSPAFLDGVACWMVDNRQHGGPPQAFVSLDLKDGKFRVLPPPPGCSSSVILRLNEMTLKQVDGRLCLFELPSPYNKKPMVELWALDGSRQCWVSTYVFHLQHPASPMNFLPVASYKKKMVVKTPHGLSYYCPVSREFEPILDVGPMNTYRGPQGYSSVVGKRDLWYFHAAPFVHSLVSPGSLAIE